MASDTAGSGCASRLDPRLWPGTHAYDDRVENPRSGPFGWLPPALRALERKLGADREDRTLWVWVVPAATFVITFAVLALIGVQGRVDLALTLPMALTLAVFLGSLSAFYLTAASSDERDKDEGPDDRPGPGDDPPGPPPPDTEVAPSVLRVPGPPPSAAERPVAAGSGGSSRR